MNYLPFEARTIEAICNRFGPDGPTASSECATAYRNKKLQNLISVGMSKTPLKSLGAAPLQSLG